MTKEQRFVKFGCSERFDFVREIDTEHVLIRCKNCGNEFSRHTTFLKSSKNHNIECRACGIHADGSFTSPLSENKRGMDESVVVDYYKKGFSATQTANKFGMNLRRVRRIIDEAGVSRDKQLVMEFDDYPDEKTGDPWLDEEFVCNECGRRFTRHQYALEMKRTNRILKPPRFCSNRCRSRSYNCTRKAKRKITRAEEETAVIPLGDIVRRDNSVCQLCGEKVDLNDGYYDANGHFHTGRLYPTLDHIMPLSKGGRHVWSNVQLAHQACNSAKKDKLPS